MIPHISKSPVRVCVNCFKGMTPATATAVSAAGKPLPQAPIAAPRSRSQRPLPQPPAKQQQQQQQPQDGDDEPKSPSAEGAAGAGAGRRGRHQFKKAPSPPPEAADGVDAVPAADDTAKSPGQPRRRHNFVKPATSAAEPVSAAPQQQEESAPAPQAPPPRRRQHAFAKAPQENIDVSTLQPPSQIMVDLVKSAVPVAREDAEELAAKMRPMSIMGDGGSDDDEDDEDVDAEQTSDSEDDEEPEPEAEPVPLPKPKPQPQPQPQQVQPPKQAPVPTKRPASVLTPVRPVPAPTAKPQGAPPPQVVAAAARPATFYASGDTSSTDTAKKTLTGPAALLNWCQTRAQPYGVTVSDFSKSWSDGLVMAALIHSYLPTSFDFDKVKTQSPKQRLVTALDAAEKVGISPLMDAEDFLGPGAPDKFCVMTAVSAYYHAFKKMGSS